MSKIKELLRKSPFKITPYVAIIAVLVLIVIISLASRRGQNATFDAFIKAYVDRDAGEIVELMPKQYISALIDAGKIENKNELEYGIQNLLDWTLDEYDDVEMSTFRYEIVYTEDASKGDSNMVMYSVEHDFGDYAQKVKKVHVVHIDPVIDAKWVDGGIREDYQQRIYVKLVKIGQSWYVSDFYGLDNYL